MWCGKKFTMNEVKCSDGECGVMECNLMIKEDEEGDKVGCEMKIIVFI